MRAIVSPSSAQAVARTGSSARGARAWPRAGRRGDGVDGANRARDRARAMLRQCARRARGASMRVEAAHGSAYDGRGAPGTNVGATAANAAVDGWRGARAPPVRGAPPLPPAQGRVTTGGGAKDGGYGGPRPVMTGGIVPEDIDAVYHQMQHLGQKLADAHAEAEMLEEAKKCVLSTITLHYIEDGNAKSAAEVQAYASQEYQEHIKKMVEARRRANVAKIELESIKTHLNLTRTYEATRREEMKLI